jgi:hypothetical protein
MRSSVISEVHVKDLFEATSQSRGELVAKALAGAWRDDSPHVASISHDELARVAPLLAGSGAAALAWWKIRQTTLNETATAEGFHQAYRLQTLRAAVRESEIERLFALLNAAGVDAVLVKGWAAGLAYPEQGLRPAGDIDLCVRPEQYAAAKDVLASPEGVRFWVDLHEGFGKLIDSDVEELYERSRTLKVGGSRVRVLCEEDHLRLLCFHLLRHGAWRPLWLCDVAAVLERRGEAFDWGRLLGRDARRARWVTSTLGLAARLLDANVEETPAARAAESLPRWLVRSVNARWARPFATEQSPLRNNAPMATYLRRPRGVLKDLRNRWPGPLEATIHVGGPFNELPRWPFQLANCFARTARFVGGTRRPVTEVKGRV